MEMLNNHGREGSSPRDDGDKDEFFPVGPAEVVAESDDDSVNQVSTYQIGLFQFILCLFI